MRKAQTILLLLLLTTPLSSPATAQTTRDSTPAASAPAVAEDTTEQAFARLVAETAAGRVLIQAQRAQIAALDEQLAAERARGDSLSKSYADAEREVSALRSANEALARAVELHEQTIKLVSEQKDRAEHKAKKANKRAAVATGAAIVLAVAKLTALGIL